MPMNATTPPPNAVYGYIVGAAIAKGRIERIDIAEAKAAPGVLAVVTHENAGSSAKAQAHTARCSPAPTSSISTRPSRSSSRRRSNRRAPPPSWSASPMPASAGKFDLAAAEVAPR